MNFTVSSTKLSSHLQAISRVIASKSPLPILDSFLFNLKGNVLTITASDLETTLITSIELDSAEGEGILAIPGKTLQDILSEFSEQPLSFNVDNENLSVEMKSAMGSYNFIGRNGDEYPVVPTLKEEFHGLMLPVNVLSEGINKTLFATSNDDLRPVMNGIYFDIKPEKLTFVASDAQKLVLCKNTGISSMTEAAFILPKKPATLLKSLLPKESGEVQLQFDDKNAVFTLSNYKMVCRQLEGRYPNYNAVIPPDNQRKVIVDRLMLMSTLKRVSLFSNQASNLIKLQLKSNSINVSAQDIDFSISAEENVDCQYSDEEMSIGFKSNYLIEILNNINSADVNIELSDASGAGLILPLENEENEELITVLMPMMLTD